jgi:hypothetical protein
MVCYVLPSHSPNSDFILTEEYLTGDQPPTRHHRRPATENKRRHISTPRFSSGSAVTSLVAAQLNTLIELASRLDSDQIDDNGPKLSINDPSSFGRNSTESANTAIGMENMYLKCQMGVDLNLGDLGLRIRRGGCSMPSGEGRHGNWGKDV